MLRKNLMSLVAAGALTTALSMSAFAGGPTTEMPAQAESGFTLGSSYGTQLNNNFVLMAGYINDSFLADFGANYTQYDFASLNHDMWEMRADLGLRNAINDTLFFTYGAQAAYGVLSNAPSATKDPYAIGAFVGLDYQPLNHLLLSFKLLPYDYVSKPTNTTGGTTTSNRVFSDGTIAASYIFA